MSIIKKKKDIKILIVNHKPSFVPQNSLLKPIQVGTALSREKLKGMAYYDNAGDDNISLLNPSYSELTAVYWAWKHLKAEYYGLFHYRRYLSFAENKDEMAGQTVRVYKNIKSALRKEYFTEEQMRRIIESHDIIVPRKEKANYSGHDSMYKHYEAAHYICDLDYCLRYIKKKYPDISRSIKTVHKNEGYAYNMFIMRADIFQKYCAFIFDVLEQFDKHNDISSYDSYQKRVDGFLAERLTSIYIYYLQSLGRYRFAELTPIYFDNASKLQWLGFLPGRVMRKVLRLLHL